MEEKKSIDMLTGPPPTSLHPHTRGGVRGVGIVVSMTYEHRRGAGGRFGGVWWGSHLVEGSTCREILESDDPRALYHEFMFCSVCSVLFGWSDSFSLFISLKLPPLGPGFSNISSNFDFIHKWVNNF